MPRTSRHKSHKQSKNSSRDVRDQSESDDLKMKEMKGKEEGSARVSRDSSSSEKRKLAVGKDCSGHGNVGSSEEYVASKRRKEKADGSTKSDRWNGDGDERGHGGTVEKEVKGENLRTDADKSSKSKVLVESNGKSSRRHDGGSERKEENVGLAAEKEETKSTSRVDSKSKSSRTHDSGSERKDENVGLAAEKEKEETKSTRRVDSKRKSEKDFGQKQFQHQKDSKDKELALEREKKIEPHKEAKEGESQAARKQGSQSAESGEEQKGNRGSENTERPIQVELRDPELEKDLEKRLRRRKDGSSEKDKNQDNVKESEDRRLSLRGERAKDESDKKDKHKDSSNGDKRREDGDRDNRRSADKYREDAERDSRHRDIKYREDGDKDNRHRDDKYRACIDRDNRHKDDDKYHEDGDRDYAQGKDKYREDGSKDNKHRSYKYRQNGDRDDRHKDDKYQEDGDRDHRHSSRKYREGGDIDDRQGGGKHRDAGDRDDRHGGDRCSEDGSRERRNREDKYRENVSRDSRHGEGKERGDKDQDKRLRDVRYRDEPSSKDRTSVKSAIKRSRDESNAVELHHSKSNYRNGSLVSDDQSSRSKNDKGRRRINDKEGRGDINSQSTRDQYSDAEKKSLSSRVETVSEGERSNSRIPDVGITPNHDRSSPPIYSSHAAKDLNRLSKQEDSKYRDNEQERRVGHNVASTKACSGVSDKASLSHSIEKNNQKDDSHLGEVAVDRCLKEDALTLPLQMVDKSRSSMSTDRRHMNKYNVRRSLDIDDSGQNSYSKDARDFSGREGRGSRELPKETLNGDELSQADGDNSFISSPFSRTSNFNSNSRSLLPPPTFRSGVDDPRVLGPLEDENRVKSNNRHRRIGDPNMGRVQSSPWRGVPNWPSPVGNGFLPFQHGPPHAGFHQVMQQFPGPLFSIRPMELNQSGLPYHVSDGDRFSGFVRPLSWHNPVDGSYPPPIQGYPANNAGFGDESHVYNRLDWDQNRSFTSGRVWEANRDMWKGQSTGEITELPSAPQKDDFSASSPADEVWPDQSGLEAQNRRDQPSIQVESINISRSGDALERSTLGAPNSNHEDPKLSRSDGDCPSNVYLSMLDISPDLTHPELYSQYKNLMCIDQNTNSEENDGKFLLMEEAIGATLRTSNKTLSTSLFPAIDDSILQKAMSLHKKLRDNVLFFNGDKLVSALTSDLVGAVSNDDKPGEQVPASDQQTVEGSVLASNEVKMEVSPAITNQKIDEPVLVDNQESVEQSIAALNEVKPELDPVIEQESLNYVIEDKSSSPKIAERSDADSRGKVEGVNRASDIKGNYSASNNEGRKLHDDAKCGPLLFSDLSSEACEAVMLESVASGSVNLSRIH